MRFLRLFAVTCLLQASVATAAPLLNVSPNPELHAWFESLKQPGSNRPCCSISDCRFTAYEENGGHFEVIVDGWKYIVPDAVVVQADDNPTGRAVVCYSYISFGPSVAGDEVRTEPQDAIEILCFLPSKPSS